jgi:hypothetical protein
MRSQRFFIILIALAVALAAVANVLGSRSGDALPAYLRTNALLLFWLATVAEFVTSIWLDWLEKKERTLLRHLQAVGLISIGAFAVALGGLVSSFAGTILPDALQPYVLPLLIVVTILTIVVAVPLFRFAVKRLTPDNRKAFLSKVRERYSNRMRDTLGDAARIDLHLREDARAITQPALAQQRLGDGQAEPAQERALPAGAPIWSVYDAAQEELLILGEPGAGKTTLLVELALELVGRAQKSKTLKMPVIFSLASWAVKRQSLEEWMAAELAETYQVSPKLAAAWVEAEEILPLLDGLDEVPEERRVACARAIEAYHQEHERVPLVVCSRRTEYFALPVRLRLQTAVIVQPLTDEQIADYLGEGTGLMGLREALAADEQLRSAARTPLLLGVMALTYQGMESEAIPRVGDETSWRRSLWAAYVPRMYHRQRGRSELQGPGEQARRGDRGHQPESEVEPPSYTQEQTIHYLSWLATQMKAHGQPDFYLERLQWDWLSEGVAREYKPIRLAGSVRWSWRRLVSGLIFYLPLGLLLGLTVGVTVGVTVEMFVGLTSALNRGFFFGSAPELVSALVSALVDGLVGGLLLGIGVGLLDGLNPLQVDERDLRQPGEGIERSRRVSLARRLVFTLASGWPAG